MKRQWTAAAAVAVAVAVAASVAIAQSSDDPRGPATDTAVESASPADLALVSTVASRAHVPGGGFGDLTDLLPNIKYRQAKGLARPLVDLVVRGTVLRVEPGTGFRNLEEEERTEDTTSDITPVAYDDPQANFRTSHLIVRVVEEIGSLEKSAPAELRVGVMHNQPLDLAALTRGLQAADSFVFFLSDNSQFYAYDPTVYEIAADATLLTRVEADGRLTLPGVDPRTSERLLKTADTLAELKQFAAGPDQTRKPLRERAIG